MAGVNDWRRGAVWSGSSSVKQRTLRGSLAASIISLRSISPSGTRKDTAPSGAVVWDGGLVGGSGGGGSAGELGRALLWW